MISHRLRSRDVEEDVVGLPEPVLVHQDDLPLSDIVVARGGAVCCARRIPEWAEVLVWPGGLEGPAESWTGTPSLRIIRIIAFDGSTCFASNEHEILAITKGNVATIHRTRAAIYEAWVSPDGRHVAWKERGRSSRGYVATLAEKLRPLRLAIEEDVHTLRWVGSERLAVVELHHYGDSEAGESLHLVDRAGRSVATAIATDEFALALGPADQEGRHATVFGFARGSRTPRPTAWEWDVGADRFECVANAAPAGGTALRVGDRCLFADGGAQEADSSRVIGASTASCRTALVHGFLRNFALSASGRSILFRTFGRRFGIAEIAVDGLVA